MPIFVHPAIGIQNNMTESSVGIVFNTCIYPGIQQCFAIAGITPGGMLCTHITPGVSKTDMDTTFQFFINNGGNDVISWYVVGPCLDHFGVGNAQWKKPLDIVKTFNKNFTNKAAVLYLVDVSAHRNEYGWGIDIRAEKRSGGIKFSFKRAFRPSETNWRELEPPTTVNRYSIKSKKEL